MLEPSRLNFAHLDHLSADVVRGDLRCRIVHIYAEAPDYVPRPDPHEGISCVDDVARAAVVYLRHFESTGDIASQAKAEGLLRFVMYMQTDAGLFFNFVLDNKLTINREHPRSRADAFWWWSARAVWALGTAVRALGESNPALADACARRVRRSYPPILALLECYPRTTTLSGRSVPLWLVGETAADATSELLLGLVAMHQARPDATLETMIARFGEGLAMMRYGSMNRFPYGAHASSPSTWHGWGNAQTQALAEAGLLDSARHEAEQFYPRLLVDGWLRSLSFDDPDGMRKYERIAYAVRCVTVGLIRLFEATGQDRYATMAGLAASWFTGNNTGKAPLYDPDTGRGYDGQGDAGDVNYNAGAESTIEALYTILEVTRHREALAWLDARDAPPVEENRAGEVLIHRIYTAEPRQVGVVMNLTHECVDVLQRHALRSFVDGGALD